MSSNQAFSMEEFMQSDGTLSPKNNEPVDETMCTAEKSEEIVALEESTELEVQKAVVEELAADKAEMHERLISKDDQINRLVKELSDTKEELAKKNSEIYSIKSSLEKVKAKASALEGQVSSLLAREIDTQERNPNALALLDRDIDLPDRFPGETRDFVLEVIKEARDQAEEQGRIRKAQVLEGVLVANEPNGNLAQKRDFIVKLFNDNGNILNGPVLDELKKLGIAHKHGDEYLLPAEIIQRNY